MRQVGEHGGLETQTRDTPLVQGVGRHLHGDEAGAIVAELAERRHQIERIRGGKAPGSPLARRVERAECTNGRGGRLDGQKVAQDESCGRLAVRARDSHQ